MVQGPCAHLEEMISKIKTQWLGILFSNPWGGEG